MPIWRTCVESSMRSTVGPLCLAIGLAICGGSATLADSGQETSARLDALFGAHEPYKAFLETLKDAIARDDRQAVAGMIVYPFATRIAGAPVTLTSKESLLHRYGELFTPAVKAAIERQTYATLFAHADGVMIGNGEIWFHGICSDQTCSDAQVKIIAVNQPDGEQ
jgi:hypothetical protein